MYAIFNTILRIYKYLVDGIFYAFFFFFFLNFDFHSDTNTFWSKKARECDDIYFFHVRFQKILSFKKYPKVFSLLEF